MKNILIIGHGVVGKNIRKELDNESFAFHIVDKHKNITCEKMKYDFGFVCVDTPLKDGELDITEVQNAIQENDCEIYVIKSTCPVGTVDRLKEKFHKRIVFSPEYYGATKHCNNFEFDFTILGGDKKDCIEVVQMMQKVYDGRHQFRITDAKTAEMTKFMENSWLATKVSFCNSFYDACEKAGIAYEEVRELFVLDPRVNPSHTFVYKETPYWDSHCLNKDVPAIAEQYDMTFLKDMIEFNEKSKSEMKQDVLKNQYSKCE